MVKRDFNDTQFHVIIKMAVEKGMNLERKKSSLNPFQKSDYDLAALAAQDVIKDIDRLYAPDNIEVLTIKK